MDRAESAASPEFLAPIAFSDIAGWRDDDHAAAFAAFLISAQKMIDALPKTRALGIDGEALRVAANSALEIAASDRDTARKFFERHFVPHRIKASGFVTGYFEPEVEASRTRSARFSVPLYRRPPDLVDVDEKNRPPDMDADIRFARRTPRGIELYPDRAAIEAGALEGQGLEIAYVESFVDAFFIHVQGSARLRLQEGGTLRIAFAAKSGHAYASIGKLAVERKLLPLEKADKDGLEAWLKANPESGRALMHENRSFIFFRETALAESDGPLGAAGVPLAALRSLAIDRTLHTFHTPIWVEAAELAMPDSAAPFRRLMIAQDTGSAIVGPARGDIFFGSGAAAGSAAGKVRHKAAMIALVPRAMA